MEIFMPISMDPSQGRIYGSLRVKLSDQDQAAKLKFIRTDTVMGKIVAWFTCHFGTGTIKFSLPTLDGSSRYYTVSKEKFVKFLLQESAKNPQQLRDKVWADGIAANWKANQNPSLLNLLQQNFVQEEDVEDTDHEEGTESELSMPDERKKSASEITGIEQKPEEELKKPQFIMALDNINQYQAGGPSACTPLACLFIADKVEPTPEALKQMIESNNYTGSDHLETDACIANLSDKIDSITTNPFGLNKHNYVTFDQPKEEWNNPSMQIPINRESVAALVNFLQAFIPTDGGAIITGNAETISLRVRGRIFEIFDSHNKNEVHGKGEGAYVYRFDFVNNSNEMVAFLLKRFPNSEALGMPGVLVVWPIIHK